MARNLTGNKRILKDACIDLYNAIQKWTSSNADCHSTIVAICLLRHKQLTDYESSLEGEIEDDSDSDSEYFEMVHLCSELKSKFSNVEQAVDKIRKANEKIKAIQDLSELESNLNPVLFDTWPLSKFCEASSEIQAMFLKEFHVKREMLKELPLLDKKPQLTFFETYWKYQPYIKQDRLNEITEGFRWELGLI